MNNHKDKFQIFKNIPKQAIGIVLLLVLSLFLYFINTMNSNQAIPALMAKVRFEGEYRIGDSEWQPIVSGKHIPATKGDVVLRGNVVLYTPDGEYIGVYTDDLPIALYTNHMSIIIEEGNNEPYIMDIENPLLGASACGVDWEAHTFLGDGSEPIEITLHNPHSFGNDTAIDEFLENMAIWGSIDFEKQILESGNAERNMGFMCIIAAFALIGTAIFSTLLHVKKSEIIWLLGLTILSAGTFFTYSSKGISFWSETIISNTTLLVISLMLYMFFISCITTLFLNKNKKIGEGVTVVLGTMIGIFLLLPIVTNIYIYDTLKYWVIIQSLANIVLFGCLINELVSNTAENNKNYFGLMLLFIAFEMDVVIAFFGVVNNSFVSQYIFVALFIYALFIVLRIIPRNINAAALTKEMEIEKSRLEAEKNMIEAELKESRVSLMLSQIQPHFIYNTLGTIERMCLKDSQKAFELVRNFSLYLRGNFSEIDSVVPIRFADEIKHIEYYVNIEKVRFPDMNIEYCLEVTNFVLPALSVQPLVENAIKHGLMKLETGGTVLIHSYETATHFCVEVKDNGGGFNTEDYVDQKKHVGLRNIRGRLKAMVNGELLIESQLGVGTRAVIMIPKEGIL